MKQKIIIAVAIILVAGGASSYFGVKQYQNYQTKKIEKEKETQGIQQQKDLEVEKLKQEVEILKNKKPEVIQQTIVKETPASKTENDLPSVINQWRPKIAYVACEWRYTNGEVSARASGSGILTNMVDSKDGAMLVILTNRHVILKDEEYTPVLCDVWLPGMSSAIRIIDEGSFYAFRGSHSGLDWGTIRFQFPTDYIKSIASSGLSICKQAVATGDKIVILGYPGIGSLTDITATEGIISGFDGDYYITSAKVEHGNSGGAAILIKDSCYLGIPTFAQVGEVESLARILKADAVFK